MSDLLEGLLADLEAEGDQLYDAVTRLDDAGWATPTPAEGWTVATQVAHLLWTDETATIAATDKKAWDAIVLEGLGDPAGYVDTCAHQVARLQPQRLLARWRAARSALADALRGFPEGQKMPWFGPPMSPASMATARFMETWAHALDVYDALAVVRPGAAAAVPKSHVERGTRPEPTDRIRHVAHLGVRTRDFAFGVHELEPPTEAFRIELTAPSGEPWTWGPDEAAQRVTGPALDFCLLVTQRIHRDDTDLKAVGADAERWLAIAQAFAGPPGEGREPR